MTREASAMAAALFAVACGGTTSNPATPSTTIYNLTGQVTNASAAPVPNATVAVLDGPNANHATTTDSTGHYTLDNLQAGAFTLQAFAAGYATVTTPVTLTASGTYDLQLRRLPVLSPQGPLTTSWAATDLYAFTLTVMNAGETCAAHVTGFVDLLDSSGATVANRGFSLPANQQIQPGGTALIQGCCFSAQENAVAVQCLAWFSSDVCQ